MDSALLAAYELIALVAIGTAIICLLVGYAWGSRVATQKELASEEDIAPLFPASDPLEWDHLFVEKE